MNTDNLLDREITSIKDEVIIQARTLHTSAGRREYQQCLLEGEQIITWALNAGWSIERVFYNKNLSKDTFLQSLVEKQVPCFAVTEGILKKISQTTYLVPYIGVSRIPPEGEVGDDFVIVLDNIRDFGNMGTIVRTADAFGIRDICTTNPESDLFYRKMIEASRGTIFNVRQKRYPSPLDAIIDLKANGYLIIATSPHAKTLQSAIKIFKNRIALIVGNETNGISSQILDHADVVVQIPMSYTVESINVGVATGISIYELRFKQVLFMLKTYIQRTLGREVNVTGKLIQRTFNKYFQAVTPYRSDQIIFLMILKCDVTMTHEQISKDIAVFEQELEEMLSPLIQNGLIQEDECHRFHLTTEGEQYLAQIWGVVDSIEKEICSDFSEAERDRFFYDLQRIQERCLQMIERRREVVQ